MCSIQLLNCRLSLLLLCLYGMNSAPVVAQGTNSQPNLEQRPPNIILIMADDVGRECFGCYGAADYKTPHIDALAEAGVRFTHCYAQPLCTPSRVKLMTGMSNVRNYSAFSVLNPDQRTLGHYFKEAGYSTLVAGKWQLLGAEHYPQQFRGKGTWPERAGFDEHCLWQVDRLGKRYWKPQLRINGETREFAEDEYGPSIITDYILDFMRRETAERADKPFLVYYPMILAHSPFQPTPFSADRTSTDKLQKLPGNGTVYGSCRRANCRPNSIAGHCRADIDLVHHR